MPLVFACIAPHGGQLLPELTQNPEEAVDSRRAMAKLGDMMKEKQPETIVLLTPHGIRIDGAMCISVSVRAAGSLGEKISVDFDVDQQLAEMIASASVDAGVPVARCIYGASAGPGSCIPLDWGSIIPLRYMGHTYEPKPHVVIVCPSRSLTLDQMVEFGRRMASAAEESSKRVALIASADQAHAHAESGPYGFDAAATDYDQAMCKVVRENDLMRLLQFDANLIERAKPDSLWQTLILAGALQVRPMRGELLSYEVPSYFGMLCAAYE